MPSISKISSIIVNLSEIFRWPLGVGVGVIRFFYYCFVILYGCGDIYNFFWRIFIFISHYRDWVVGGISIYLFFLLILYYPLFLWDFHYYFLLHIFQFRQNFFLSLRYLGSQVGLFIIIVCGGCRMGGGGIISFIFWWMLLPFFLLILYSKFYLCDF